MTSAEIYSRDSGVIAIYELGVKELANRLVFEGAISQYKADMLIKHGVGWVDDGVENAKQ